MSKVDLVSVLQNWLEKQPILSGWRISYSLMLFKDMAYALISSNNVSLVEITFYTDNMGNLNSIEDDYNSWPLPKVIQAHDPEFFDKLRNALLRRNFLIDQYTYGPPAHKLRALRRYRDSISAK